MTSLVRVYILIAGHRIAAFTVGVFATFRRFVVVVVDVANKIGFRVKD